MLRLVFTRSAQGDLRQAIDWYDAQRPGLGAGFESAVEAVLERALHMPHSFPAVMDDFRRAAVRRFPYDIYYRITERQLVVVLVFHTARDPQSAIARLQPPH